MLFLYLLEKLVVLFIEIMIIYCVMKFEKENQPQILSINIFYFLFYVEMLRENKK